MRLKSLTDDPALLLVLAAAIHRILKPEGQATVVFHSATADVWNALQGAYQNAGFQIERTSVLDKTQGSFKQVTTDGAVRGETPWRPAGGATRNTPADPGNEHR
jgi:hypothetical protein